MSRVPNLSCRDILRGLRRDGWVVVRQRGSHIRLQKHIGDRTLKLTVPAYRSVKHSTLMQILKQAELPVDRFTALL